MRSRPSCKPSSAVLIAQLGGQVAGQVSALASGTTVAQASHSSLQYVLLRTDETLAHAPARLPAVHRRIPPSFAHPAAAAHLRPIRRFTS